MYGWHDTPWMWLSMLVFWTVVIVLAYRLFRGRTRPSTPPATEILDDRLARGEISVTEHRERRDALAAQR